MLPQKTKKLLRKFEFSETCIGRIKYSLKQVREKNLYIQLTNWKTANKQSCILI